MPKTYDSLYSRVVREIEKRAGKKITETDTRFSVQPGGEGGSLSARDIAEIISTLTTDLAELISPSVISGLDVTAKSPPTNTINITAGTATSHGKKWILDANTSLNIPFNNSTQIFFITIYENTLQVNDKYDSTKCEVCRIIVPNPGKTFRIVDDRPKDGFDAWIVSSKEIVFGENTEFDATSVEKLRDVIGPVLADNLIGNIRLSENLKIMNTQGTLKLNSNSLELYTPNEEKLMASFTDKGVFFYNDKKIPIAQFGISEAYLGNILITKNSIQTRKFIAGSNGFQIKDNGNVEFNEGIFRGTLYADSGLIGGISIEDDNIRSSNFVSGLLGKGFQILSDGSAEFNDITARGRISTSVFEKNTLSAVSGNLLIMDADILDTDMDSKDAAIELDFMEYSTDDVIRTAYVTSAESSVVWTQRAPLVDQFYKGIRGIAVFNDKIYCGGSSSGYLYEWDGVSAWNTVAANTTAHHDSNDGITCLVVYNDELYAGSDSAYTTLLKWNGINTWIEVSYYESYGALGNIQDLIVFSSKLYAGTFGSTNPNLLEWDNVSAWISRANPINSQKIMSLAIFNNELYAGTNPLANLQKWNGTNAWTLLASQPGISTFIYDLAVFSDKLYGCSDDGKLYEFDTDEWIEKAPALGAEPVWALIVYNDVLYGGTYNNSTGGKLYAWNNVDAWIQKVAGNSSAWFIWNLVEYHDYIYAGTYRGGYLYAWYPNLIASSEPTIKTQGFFSLKAEATTDSLNETLTRTVSPAINLSDQNIIKFDARASRTGSNIKISFHNSNDYIIETTPNILVVDTFQAETIDLSAVAVADKNAIDSITIEILDATNANNFYIDNMFAHIETGGIYAAPLTIKGDVTFSLGDIVRMKDSVDDEWLQIAEVSQAPTYAVERDKAGNYPSNLNPVWKKGTAIVSYGHAGEGGVYLSGSEANSPYISIVTHDGDPWNTIDTVVRIGNLNGFLGYATDISGIAIGDEDSYIKYDKINGVRIHGVTTV